MESTRRRCLILLILFTLSDLTASRKVLDRFPGGKIPIPKRCVVGVFGEMDKQVGAMGQLTSVLSGIIRIFRQMNCTYKPEPYATSGVLSLNGSYDGISGMIQRDEIDFTHGFWRTDFFGSVQPGYFSKVFQPADVVIISRKNGTSTKYLTLMQLWTSQFDRSVVSYVFICLYLFVSVFSFSLDISSRPLRYIKRILHSLYQSMAAFFDQENFDPRNLAQCLAVLFFNLFLLFAVHGVLLGSLGADLVAEIDPPIIESVYEFTNDSWTQPVTVRQEYLLEVLRKSRPESQLYHLKQVIMNREDNIMDLDASNLDKLSPAVMSLVDSLVSSRKALLAPQNAAEAGRSCGCFVMPSSMSLVAASKSTLAEGSFATLYSKKIDPMLREFADYLVMSASDAGLFNALRSGMGSTMSSMISGETTMFSSAWRECMEGAPRRPHEARQFSPDTFSAVYTGFGVLMSLAFIILLIECLVKKTSRRKLPKRNTLGFVKREEPKEIIRRKTGRLGIRVWWNREPEETMTQSQSANVSKRSVTPDICRPMNFDENTWRTEIWRQQKTPVITITDCTRAPDRISFLVNTRPVSFRVQTFRPGKRIRPKTL